jgi:hypothetical protein
MKPRHLKLPLNFSGSLLFYSSAFDLALVAAVFRRHPFALISPPTLHQPPPPPESHS